MAASNSWDELHLLRSVIAAVGEPIFAKDRRGCYVLVNEAAAAAMGRPPAECLGRDDAELLGAAQAHDLSARDRRVLDAGIASSTEEELATALRRCTYLTTKVPYRNAQGEVVGLIGMARDITDRKAAERAHQRTHRLLEALRRAQCEFLEHADPRPVFDHLLRELLAVTDSSYGFIGEVIYGNQGRPYLQTHAISDISWDDATRALYEQNAPAGMQFHNLRTLFGAVIETERPVIANDPHADPRRGGLPPRHPPLERFLGLPLHHGARLVGIVGLANRPAGYDDALVRDLQPFLLTCAALLEAIRAAQRRQQLEQSLRRSEGQFRSLVEATSDWVWEVDQHAVYTYASPKVLELLGYEPSEVVGRTPFDLMPPNEAERVAGIFGPIAAARKPFQDLENVNRHKDGRLVVLETSGVPLFDERGEFCGYRGIDRDVTCRKEMEEQMRRQQVELAHVARLSTMGELVAGISHEINQPLYAIQNFAAACQAAIQTDPERVRSWLQQIREQARRAGDILARLRGFARKRPPQRSALDPGEMIREAVALLAPDARQRQVRVELNLNGELPPVFADRTEVQQVLVNLLRNALEALEQVSVESRRATIGASVQPEWVLFTVSDSGPGLPALPPSQLFETFFTTKPSGLGMGLSIARSLVEGAGGRLWAETVAPGGACFSFTLPQAEPCP
jgi:PAS domain S-box-containing protein